MSPKAKHTSPFRLYGIIALLLSIGGSIALYIGLSVDLLLSWLVSVNVVAFLFFGFDKMRAQGGGLRVPENILYSLVLLGGFVGGISGMFLFRHKTRKSSFQRIFWAIIVLEIVIVAVWLWIG